MNYEALLDGYLALPIYFNDIVGLITNNARTNYKGLRSLNEPLFLLLSTINEDKNPTLISHLKLTKGGISFDGTKIRKRICAYIGLNDDENLIDNLHKLSQNIKSNKITTPNFSALMEKDYQNYQLIKYMNSKAKKSTIEKAKRQEFLFKIRMLINKFELFLLNSEKYLLVDISFDLDKLKLYLAVLIMEHAKNYQKSDTNNYDYALRYLKRFVDNYDNVNQVISYNKKDYKLLDILNFISYNDSLEKNKQNEEKYNYSFFESIETKNEILSSLTRFGLSNDNSEELKEILYRKIRFYESLDFTKIKIGVDSFDGYIGFELSSGFVILDKLYDNLKEGKIATDNAIYIVNIEDFEKITKMSKADAMTAINQNLIEARRIIHTGNYESRVENYIEENKNERRKYV